MAKDYYYGDSEDNGGEQFEKFKPHKGHQKSLHKKIKPREKNDKRLKKYLD